MMAIATTMNDLAKAQQLEGLSDYLPKLDRIRQQVQAVIVELKG
jgi:hypothetical protein